MLAQEAPGPNSDRNTDRGGWRGWRGRGRPYLFAAKTL